MPIDSENDEYDFMCFSQDASLQCLSISIVARSVMYDELSEVARFFNEVIAHTSGRIRFLERTVDKLDELRTWLLDGGGALVLHWACFDFRIQANAGYPRYQVTSFGFRSGIGSKLSAQPGDVEVSLPLLDRLPQSSIAEFDPDFAEHPLESRLMPVTYGITRGSDLLS